VHDDLIWLLALSMIYVVVSFRTRDFYVVVREYRIVAPNEFGKGKKIENSYVHYFDDYCAARAFRDLQDSYAALPQYEDQQNINYLYAVPALTAKRASAKMTKGVHHQAKLLVETPHSRLYALKKHWDEEREARAELERSETEAHPAPDEGSPTTPTPLLP
jgi:hypothetical protein